MTNDVLQQRDSNQSSEKNLPESFWRLRKGFYLFMRLTIDTTDKKERSSEVFDNTVQPIQLDLNETDVQIDSDEEEDTISKHIQSFSKVGCGTVKLRQHDYSNTSTNNDSNFVNSSYQRKSSLNRPYRRYQYRMADHDQRLTIRPQCQNKLIYHPKSACSSQIELDSDDETSPCKNSEPSGRAHKENISIHYQRLMKNLKTGLKKSVKQHKKGWPYFILKFPNCYIIYRSIQIEYKG